MSFFLFFNNFLPVNEKPNEFKEWMDERRLKASDVCEALHVSEQTIHQWRSFGVPPRRIPHVDRYMLEWVDPANVQPPGITDEALAAFVESKQNLVLHPTEDEFDAWNRAALAERKTLKDWAHDGLAEIASIAHPSRGNGTEGP